MPTCPLCARPVRSRLVRDDLPREWRDRPLRRQDSGCDIPFLAGFIYAERRNQPSAGERLG
jgi:hypothetical protein